MVHMVILFNFWRNYQTVFKEPPPFTFPLAMYEGCSFSMYLQTFAIILKIIILSDLYSVNCWFWSPSLMSNDIDIFHKIIFGHMGLITFAHILFDIVFLLLSYKSSLFIPDKSLIKYVMYKYFSTTVWIVFSFSGWFPLRHKSLILMKFNLINFLFHGLYLLWHLRNHCLIHGHKYSCLYFFLTDL